MESSIILHNLSRGDLENLIARVVKNQLQAYFELETTTIENELLTREEACSLLKICKTSLWKWTKNGKLKAYGIGNRVFYKKSEVLNGLKRIN